MPQIHREGLKDSPHSDPPGVHFAPPGTLWIADCLAELDFALLDDEKVVYKLDIPDAVAAEYARREQVPTIDDTGDDIPDDLTDDLTDDNPANWASDSWPVTEYVVPAKVANQHRITLVHWTGEEP